MEKTVTFLAMACQQVWNRCSTSWAKQTVGETGVSSNTWLDYITRCCCDAINVVRHEHFQLFFSERQGKGWLTRLHVDFEDTTCTHQHIIAGVFKICRVIPSVFKKHSDPHKSHGFYLFLNSFIYFISDCR